ncbi:MAG: Hydroxymethylglutaryl-CoA reductase [Dehalococcoidia bacterium]|nr:Hydroxymethylglutaryl-CoA reductase [Dehalococcoidia bacterium]
MIAVPEFLLRSVYVKGSLSNGADGFQFQMRNTLGSGYAKRLMPLTVDGEEIPMEESFLTVGGERFPFSAVSEERPFALALNRTINVVVVGHSLEKGPHKIGMGFHLSGLGDLSFHIMDVI